MAHKKNKDKCESKKKREAVRLDEKTVRRIANKVYKRFRAELCLTMNQQQAPEPQGDPNSCRYNPAAYNCSAGTDKDYECSPVIGAYGCASDTPGGAYNCGRDTKFTCEGGAFDDFECGQNNTFTCNEFVCTSSFDDEDCEGEFNCGEEGFSCGNSGNDYN